MGIKDDAINMTDNIKDKLNNTDMDEKAMAEMKRRREGNTEQDGDTMTQ